MLHQVDSATCHSDSEILWRCGRVSERLIATASFLNISKGLLRQATRKDGQTRRQAIPPTINMLEQLESLVVIPEAHTNDRLIAWWCLVASCGVLRFDDHRGLDPASIQEFGCGWTVLRSRTKTTGRDKGVGLRSVTIGAEAFLTHPTWMGVGTRL